MKNRVYIVLGMLLVAALGWAAWQALPQGPPEPVYDGKPLSAWLKALVLERNPSTASIPTASFGPVSKGELNAEMALSEAGTNAIPTLLRMLRARDWPMEARLMELVKTQHIIKIDIEYAAPEVWSAVAEYGFHLLGAKAESAVPALIEIANQNISVVSQCRAIHALEFIGPSAKEAVPVLLRCATSPDATRRGSAVAALGKIHAKPDRVVPILVNALQDPDAGVRRDAVWALFEFASDAKVAVPMLANALQDPDSDVRRGAVFTLKRIGPDAKLAPGLDVKLAVPALVDFVNGPNDRLSKQWATDALKAIDPEAAAKAGVVPRSP